ncbi:MAG: diguanylate cyclase [Helicobacteraceae bacterium]|jgi:diguanylate cyclase (GGDEF)-like protein|nr:diguanylate cyclase [Helicobacteraceae bacterium]
MATIELDKIARDISREALELLDRTATPALPLYYAKAFSDVAEKYGAQIERELNDRYLNPDSAAHKSLELSLELARDTLLEYSTSALRFKDIANERESALDLKKLESDAAIPAAILEEIKLHFGELNGEVKKAEETIVRLESDLNKVEVDSYVDSLTRLRTPMLLKRQLGQILEVGLNRNLDLWIALAAIDNYHDLKEKYGYVVTDKILLFIAKSLQGSIRSDNRIYRYNENSKHENVFCVVFNRSDQEQARLAIKRVQSRVETSKLVYQDKIIDVTIGAALIAHRAADTAESICARAEATLRKALKQEKNAVLILEN